MDSRSERQHYSIRAVILGEWPPCKLIWEDSDGIFIFNAIVRFNSSEHCRSAYQRKVIGKKQVASRLLQTKQLSFLNLN